MLKRTSGWGKMPKNANSTDAEGRLALVDTLVYTCNQGVEKGKSFQKCYEYISEKVKNLLKRKLRVRHFMDHKITSNVTKK
ncbi:hypothetical protein Taro_051808 [Colocasia esculenta]|uniref:Cytosol aminopeptidase domain-containing protein n=1 Tax=Colocasia esculenta TaxID=4460 RepID=A0A843XHZ0_COLES|nr:hypothetical protein [Colocasia esculenta]